MADINNTASNTLLSGTSGDDSIQNGGYWDDDDGWHYGGSNVTINVGAGDDSIDNYGDSVTIDAGAGNDYIINEKYWNGSKYIGADNVTIDAGNGNDTIDNTGNRVLISAGAGSDSIENRGSSASINAGDGNDSIQNRGSSVTIDAGAGNDYIWNDGSSVTITAGTGNDYIDNHFGDQVSINGGAGNDHIWNNGSSVTITAGTGNDSIYNYGEYVIIDAGAGNDSIWNEGSNVSIDAGDGDDTIRNYGYYGGNTLTGGAGADLFIYEISYSDVEDISNDIITDYEEEDTLRFVYAIKKISTNSAGSVVFTFKTGDNKLVVKNAADKVVTYIDSDGNTKIFGEKKSWKLDGTTATYGSLTVTGVTSLDGLSLNGKVVTVSAASLGTKDVTISDGYTLALGDDVSSAATKKSWTLKNSTATYKQTTSAGYSLADNTITYTKKSSKTLVTVTGVTSLDGLKLSKKVVTVSAASLGTSDVTISDGYTLKLGSDVSAPTTKKSWTLKNSTATYKQTTSAGYSLADNEIIYTKKSSKTLVTVTGVTNLGGLKLSKKVVTVSAASLGTKNISISNGYTLALGSDVSSATTKKSWSLSKTTATYKQTTSAGYSLADNEITYTKKSSKTLATVKGVTSTDGLKVSGKTVKLAGSSLSKKVTVSGGYTFDFASDFKNASITGSSSADTIIARGKNIFVTGGAGADIFAVKPTVANVINDYDSEDKISLTSGAANISVSGSDVIFNGKLTVVGAADKVVTYIEGGAEKIFKKVSDGVKYNSDGTGATLTATYDEDDFAANSTLATINASAVNYGLSIIGNRRANVITGTSEDDYIDGQASGDTLLGGGGNDTLVGGAGNDCLVGGTGNDSLWGGTGSDTLFGGDGKDIFIYRDGDGDDIISGYEAGDIVKVFSDNVVNAPTTDSDGNVTFQIGGGQITFENAADKYIELFIGDSNNTYDKKYRPAGK